MSERFPGGFLTNTPPAPTSSAAPGVWTQDQALQNIKAGNWPSPPEFIEDVFSTWLYTGNSGTQTITNGIDLAGKGGLIWAKDRTAANSHQLYDTVRGNTKRLITDQTAAEGIETTAVTAFNSNGFSLGAQYEINSTGANYVAWTFRQAPKFHAIASWTGDGVEGRVIPHTLGSTPGCIIIKRTDASAVWLVNHVGLSGGITGSRIFLNQTTAQAVGVSNVTAVSSSTFTVTATGGNNNGGQFIAYLFAHDTTANGLIQCGSYTGNGSTSGPSITLGWEPQWILVKNATGAANWWVVDNMRGMPVDGYDSRISPNTADAENNGDLFFAPTATGFKLETASANVNGSGATYIYIAIRRGPMRVPTDGTKVFSANIATDTEGQGVVKTTNFPVDLQITKSMASSGQNWTTDRLRGVSTNTTDFGRTLTTNSTDAESTSFAVTRYWNNTGFQISSAIGNSSQIYWNFRRAPGFFDAVCYTGTGSTTAYAHNLGVAPELMIVKSRNDVNDWIVYSAALGNTKYLTLNSTAAETSTYPLWASTSPTATTFTTNGTYNFVGGGGITYVAYLFASCPGVSKVGSYTGTGTTLQVNCGFTSGARFVLIKRTDSTGDWYVWDSARGIVAGNDPYLLLNSTAAEVTSTDYVDTYSAGFEISSTAPAAINASGGSFIFLAIS